MTGETPALWLARQRSLIVVLRRRARPAEEGRGLRPSALVAVAIGALMLAVYLPYGIFPDWAYLRFLLPAWRSRWCSWARSTAEAAGRTAGAAARSGARRRRWPSRARPTSRRDAGTGLQPAVLRVALSHGRPLLEGDAAAQPGRDHLPGKRRRSTTTRVRPSRGGTTCRRTSTTRCRPSGSAACTRSGRGGLGAAEPAGAVSQVARWPRWTGPRAPTSARPRASGFWTLPIAGAEHRPSPTASSKSPFSVPGSRFSVRNNSPTVTDK